MKTVTFDETLWQVVPKKVNYFELQEAAEVHGLDYNKFCAAYNEAVLRMLAAAPTPPVVEQEPVAEVRIFNNGFCDYTDVSWDRSLLKAGDKLYPHPAPSELESLRQDAPLAAIDKILIEVMDIAVTNGANSLSMPDEYVEVAAWLCKINAAMKESKNETA